MATINKTKSRTWKAQIRLAGWPNLIKMFRMKRDAENWARTTEDEIIRGIHVSRSNSEKLTIASALDRYVKEVIPTKKPSGHRRETGLAEFLKSRLGQYSLAALNSELIAAFRDERLAKVKADQHSATRTRPTQPYVHRGDTRMGCRPSRQPRSKRKKAKPRARTKQKAQWL